MGFRVLAVLVVLSFVSCKGGLKEQKIVKEVKSDISDSTLIFNGKSLDGWAITNFGAQGPVYISGDAVILGMGEGCTGITREKDFPLSDYRVSLEAKRVAGNDFFCGITFPAGEYSCTLIVGGWGGTVVGLSTIYNKDASENETTTLKKFDKDRWYDICLTVKRDTINAKIDGVNVINFVIDDKKLSVRPEVELSKPFGIASWNTTAALRNIRVQKIKE